MFWDKVRVSTYFFKLIVVEVLAHAFVMDETLQLLLIYTPSAWGHVFASSWRRYFMGVESRDFSEVLGTNFQ